MWVLVSVNETIPGFLRRAPGRTAYVMFNAALRAIKHGFPVVEFPTPNSECCAQAT